MREEPVARLEGNEAGLERVVCANGDAIERRALFVRPAQHQRSDLAHRLGCAFHPTGLVQADGTGQTNVPGVYVAGDAGRPQQQAIFAAADGALAAISISNELLLAEQPITSKISGRPATHHRPPRRPRTPFRTKGPGPLQYTPY